jgi:antibiotic biosynthesis monooxygenase (ABM) superfamily enzyme
VPIVIAPVLRILHFPDNHFITTLAVTGVIVFLMVYWIMPHYTRFIQRWLFS